jgi:hypothetical protein
MKTEVWESKDNYVQNKRTGEIIAECLTASDAETIAKVHNQYRLDILKKQLEIMGIDSELTGEIFDKDVKASTRYTRFAQELYLRKEEAIKDKNSSGRETDTAYFDGKANAFATAFEVFTEIYNA